MKQIVTLVLVFTTFLLSAQSVDNSYNIIQIRGDIYNISSGSNLQQGNILKPKDKLEFQNNSFAFVISNAKRKYSLKMPYTTDTDELFAYAELSLSLVHSRGQLSTRGAIGETGVKDLKTYLGQDNFNIIGNNHDILLDENLYPLNDDEFIVFYYKINNKQISKKVGFNNQVLNLNKEKLKEGSGEILDSDTLSMVNVYQYKKSSGESQLLTKINLAFIDENELKKEFLTIIPILKKQNMIESEISEYLFGYFYDIYGQVDDDQLEQLVNAVLTQ